MENIYKFSTIKAKETDDRVLRFIGSDSKTDRDGDQVKSDGWKLTEYRKNPVVLLGHNYGDVPVAKTKKVWVDSDKNQLMFDIEFPEPEVSSIGDSLYKLYKAGYMKATSVGFMPNHDKIEYPKRKQGKANQPWRVFNEQTLLEISLVSVPANPRALLTSKSIRKAIDDDIIDELELNEILDYFVNKDKEFKTLSNMGYTRNERIEELIKEKKSDKIVDELINALSPESFAKYLEDNKELITEKFGSIDKEGTLPLEKDEDGNLKVIDDNTDTNQEQINKSEVDSDLVKQVNKLKDELNLLKDIVSVKSTDKVSYIDKLFDESYDEFVESKDAKTDSKSKTEQINDLCEEILTEVK